MPDLDAVLDSDKMRDIAARALELLELRARQRSSKPSLTKRSTPGSSRWAQWAQAQCPNVAAGRLAFEAFSVPPGRRVYLPTPVAGFVRMVMVRTQHPIGALGALLDGDLGRYASQYTSAVMRGRRPVAAADWARMKEFVEPLAIGLSLEHEPDLDRGACVDLAAVLADRLSRSADRSRDSVDGEVIGLQMKSPLVAAVKPPRAVFPRYTQLATAAA